MGESELFSPGRVRRANTDFSLRFLSESLKNDPSLRSQARNDCDLLTNKCEYKATKCERRKRWG